MKPGDLVRIRIPNGWITPAGVEDSQVGLLLEIRPIEYPIRGDREHDYIVLLGGTARSFKKRLLERAP